MHTNNAICSHYILTTALCNFSNTDRLTDLLVLYINSCDTNCIRRRAQSLWAAHIKKSAKHLSVGCMYI